MSATEASQEGSSSQRRYAIPQETFDIYGFDDAGRYSERRGISQSDRIAFETTHHNVGWRANGSHNL